MPEPVYPPLCSSAGGGLTEKGKCQIPGPGRRRCDADTKEQLRIRHPDWGHSSDVLDDLLASAEGIDQREDVQATGVAGRERDLVGDRRNLSSRLVVQQFPVGAYG